ncbi:hypothetical protein OGAPHI_002580 [Ogataea philodendri]|uniref:ER membrane protein complex subunit 4 n=1 Tax=Ogataea philodendri TaxID=1378263 RepID=A0A9P8T847_9ASCO|nr:uncharacterized protein OGAPHI_002580 [Ogataea philodendri]KAH3668825.1 hypothetical protein OGAPHI_002580 [Ogataea philodendri]
MDWIDQYRTPTTKTVKAPKKTAKNPPGFNDQFFKQWKDGKVKTTEKSSEKSYDLEKLKKQRAWDVAISPAKNIPMNLIMMYMSPNSLQLIPIMMVLMLFVNSAKEIFQVKEKFEVLELKNDPDKTMLQILYVACCLGNMLVGVWKLNKLGLIPNRSSDWLSWEQVQI